MRNAYKNLVEKPKGHKILAIPRNREESSKNGRKFLDQLRHYLLFKKEFA
jgi:hypothetical protein